MTNETERNTNFGYCTIREAAKTLSCSDRYIRDLIEDRENNHFPVCVLPSKRGIRNTYRINKKRFESWLDNYN